MSRDNNLELHELSQEYKNEVYQTLNNVLGSRFQDELSTIPTEKQLEYRKRKIKVATEAILQGRPRILAQLEQGTLEVHSADGTISRRYQKIDDQITWKLLSKATDPFAQAEYYQWAKQSGEPLQGESDLLTDPVLVNLMLGEGLSIYQEFFEEFKRVADLSKSVQQTDLSSCSYLQSPQAYWEMINERLNRWQTLDRSILPEQDIFAEEFIIPNDAILSKLPFLEKLATDVLTLDRFLLRDGKPAIGDHRTRLERTLATEFITNPDVFRQMDTAREPRTTFERVASVNQLVIHFLEGSNEEERRYRLAWITQIFMEKYTHQIDQFTAGTQVSANLARDYLQSLVYRHLLSLPNPSFSPDSNTPGRGLNNYYILRHPINDQGQRLDLSRSAQPAEVSAPDAHDRSLMIFNLVNNKRVSVAKFGLMSDPEREDIIWKVLSSPLTADKKVYFTIVRNLIQLSRLEFSKTTGYLVPQRADWPPKWVDPFQKDLLARLQEKVAAGDQNLINCLVRLFGRQMMICYVGLRGKRQFIESYQVHLEIENRRTRSAKGIPDEVRLSLPDKAAQAVLGYYYGEITPQNEDLEEIIQQNISLTSRFPSLVNPQELPKFIGEVRRQIQELTRKMRAKYFPEANIEDDQVFVNRVLEKSLQALDIPLIRWKIEPKKD